MRHILASVVIAAAAMTFFSSEASAWYCRASSPSAYGWGTGGLGYARARALAECAARTPTYQTCYIRYCR
jgi:hypothetical protein